MRLNLSSQIVLNKVPVEFYKPKTLKSPEWRRFIQISLPLWQKVPVM